MAAPNIVNVATITGITTGASLTTSTSTSLVMNPASSGKVFKINSVIVANVDGSSAADVTLKYYDGSGTFNIAKVVTVPAKTTLVAVDKNASIFATKERVKSIREQILLEDYIETDMWWIGRRLPRLLYNVIGGSSGEGSDNIAVGVYFTNSYSKMDKGW